MVIVKDILRNIDVMENFSLIIDETPDPNHREAAFNILYTSDAASFNFIECDIVNHSINHQYVSNALVDV